MLYVYVDESGDLGFSGNSSRHFVLCAITTRNPYEVRRIIKRTREKIMGKTFSRTSELKFNKSPRIVRQAVLEMLAGLDVEIWYVCLNKESVTRGDSVDPNEVYSYLAGFMVERMLTTRTRKAEIVIDRCMSKANREMFDDFILERCESTAKDLRRLPMNVAMFHMDSQSEQCLQVADFAAGAIFRKHERGDAQYYDTIKSRISEEILKRKW